MAVLGWNYQIIRRNDRSRSRMFMTDCPKLLWYFKWWIWSRLRLASEILGILNRINTWQQKLNYLQISKKRSKKYLFSYKESRPKDHFLAEFEYSVYLSSVLHEIFLPNSTSSVDPKLVLRHQININIKQISKCKEKTTFWKICFLSIIQYYII